MTRVKVDHDQGQPISRLSSTEKEPPQSLGIPPIPTTLTGGCNCTAIRYTITLPPLANRPNLITAICHCNDCRHATAQLNLMGFCCPTTYITFHLLLKDSVTVPSWPEPGNGKHHDGGGGIWEGEGTKRVDVPAKRAVEPGPETSNTFFQQYRSSHKASRDFCTNCGTPVSYFFHNPLPEGAVETMDVYIGSLDTKFLDGKAENGAEVRPASHVHWDLGIEWIKRLYREGDRTLGYGKDEDGNREERWGEHIPTMNQGTITKPPKGKN